MAMPRVEVLVINWNGREHLEACFDSLLASDYPNAHFLLVDNASSDDSVAYVEQRYGHDPRVSVLCCPGNLGWGGGNNFALRRVLADTHADYVFLLNNDTAISPGAIRHMVALAEAQPDIGCVAPKMVLFHQSNVLNSLGLACSYVGASWDLGVGRIDAGGQTPQDVIGACGGAMLLRCEVLRTIGLLPEDFEIYLDDLDLCLRVWEAGYRVVTCPEAVIRHKFSATLGEGARARHKYYLNTRNRYYMMLRRFPASSALGTVFWCALAEARAVGRALLDGEPSRAAAHLRAVADGLRYWPVARRARRADRAAGLRLGVWWPLLTRARMFCPAVVLPSEGRYPAVHVQGHRLHPLAGPVTVPGSPAPRRVTLASAYPALGAAEVYAQADGAARVHWEATAPRTFELPPGPEAELRPVRVFRAEATGLPYDCMGWAAWDVPAAAPIED